MKRKNKTHSLPYISRALELKNFFFAWSGVSRVLLANGWCCMSASFDVISCAFGCALCGCVHWFCVSQVAGKRRTRAKLTSRKGTTTRFPILECAIPLNGVTQRSGIRQKSKLYVLSLDVLHCVRVCMFSTWILSFLTHILARVIVCVSLRGTFPTSTILHHSTNGF